MWNWLIKLIRGYNICGECKHLYTCWKTVDNTAREYVACDDFEKD